MDAKLKCRDVVGMGSADSPVFRNGLSFLRKFKRSWTYFDTNEHWIKSLNPSIEIPNYAPEKYRQSCTTLLTCKSWKTLTTPFDASRIRWALLSVAKVDLASWTREPFITLAGKGLFTFCGMARTVLTWWVKTGMV